MSKIFDTYVLFVNTKIIDPEEAFELFMSGMNTGSKLLNWIAQKVYRPRLHKNGTITWRSSKARRSQMVTTIEFYKDFEESGIRDYRILNV